MHWRPKLTVLLNRSRSSQGHNLSKLCRAPLADAKFQNHRPSGSGEVDFKRLFAIYSYGGHLGHVT